MNRRAVQHYLCSTCAMPCAHALACTAPAFYVRYVFLLSSGCGSQQVFDMCVHNSRSHIDCSSCTRRSLDEVCIPQRTSRALLRGQHPEGRANLHQISSSMSRCCQTLACISCQLCLDVLCDLTLLCAAYSKVPASLRVQESQHKPPMCL